MENKYQDEFDQFFARDLKHAGKNAQPGSNEWHDLSRRLDTVGTARGRYKYLFWILIPLLLFANGWSLFQWQVLQSEVAALRQATLSDSMTGITAISRDTIIYDTIYRTLVVNQYVLQSHSGKWSETTASPRIYEDSPFTETRGIPHKPVEIAGAPAPQVGTEHALTSQRTNPLTPEKSERPMTEPWLSDKGTKHLEDSSYVNQPALEPLRDGLKGDSNLSINSAHPRPYDSLSASIQGSLAPSKVHRNPMRWRVGLGVGVIPSLNDVGLNTFSGFVTALHGEVLLGKHWAIAPGLHFAGYSFEIKSPIHNQLLIEIPSAPNVDYKLRHLEGNMSHWIPSLALRYRFRPENTWVWYTGLGYAARVTASSQLEFEYVESGTNLEYKIEQESKFPTRHLGSVQMGLEYNLPKRWMLFGELNGMADLGNGQRTFPMLNCQLGLKWGMK